MTGRTPNYSFSTIANSGDGNLSDDGFKFTNDDRGLMDRLFKAEANHHHIGGTNAATTPVDAPELSLSTTGGTLQAGIRIYYKYTLVDENGFESAASAESTVDTPAQITTPGAATLSNLATTGGSLAPGSYFYVLSAYSGGVSTQETRAGGVSNILVPAGTSTNVVRLTFPTLPANADGWNIYMKQPGSTQYFWLVTVDMTVATPPTYYDDDGVPAVDCARIAPSVNTTLSSNSVTITFPGATPIVPDGFTWRIYRTFILSNYTNSLLHWVVEEVSPGVIDPEFVDTGTSTGAGNPPTATLILDNPDPVDLTDAAEVQGRLPIGNVTAFPFVVTFVTEGPLTGLAPMVGEVPWTCEFPQAYIAGCRAVLGVGSEPAGQSVIVDVNKYAWSAATPTLSTIYTTQANRPKVLVGESVGVRTVPDVRTLVAGDQLTVDLDQSGGGATPTDETVVVQIAMLVQFDEATSNTLLWD